jgi:predicted ATPase
MSDPKLNDRLFIITGGPGSGKTALLDALEKAGFARTVEAGRAIIQDQVLIGGNALPWGDRAAFAELMLALEMRSYALARRHDGPVFFDRGVPDTIGYLRLIGAPIPLYFHKAADRFRYRRRVWVAPPWREIFTTDAERKQDFAEAERTYHVMRETYAGLGYELVILPCVPVQERARFVLDGVLGTR